MWLDQNDFRITVVCSSHIQNRILKNDRKVQVIDGLGQIKERKLIIMIDRDIGLLTHTKNDDLVARLFGSQLIQFDQLKALCLEGHQELPRFDVFVNDQIDVPEDNKQQRLIKVLEYIENLQINQILKLSSKTMSNYQEFIEKWFQYQNTKEKDFLQQQLNVESQIVLLERIDAQIQNLQVNCQIVNKQLEAFINISNKQSNDI